MEAPIDYASLHVDLELTSSPHEYGDRFKCSLILYRILIPAARVLINA